MLREGLLRLSESELARRLATDAPFAREVGRRFVAGETIGDAVRAARELNREGISVSLDYLGEAVESRRDARAAADVYRRLFERIAAEELQSNVSLKLTQLGQDIGEQFLHDTVVPVLDRAGECDLFIRFDMESSAYTQRTLDFFARVWEEGYRGIGAVIQSMLRRSEEDVHRLNERGARVRLCKGAYKEPSSVAFQHKDEVDASFARCMRALLTEGTYPGIATHDESLIRATQDFARERGIANADYEFQMLYGVRRDLQRELVARGYNLRVYVPFGEAWYPYFMRRLAERPANVFFIANALVRESPLGWLAGRNSRRR